MDFHRRGRTAVVMVALAGIAAVSWPSGGRARAATGAGTNLMTGAEATFDTGIGSWACVSNCIAQWASTQGQAGTGSLAVQQTSTGGDQWVLSGSSLSAYLPVSPGLVYTAGASVIAGGSGRTIAPLLAFANPSGEIIANTFGTALVDGTQWAPSTVSGVAPANAAFAVLGFVIAGALPFERHYFDNAYVTPRPGAAPAVVGPLHTSGNHLIDATGHTVVLRGLMRTGTESSSGSFPTDAEIAAAKAWGANAVRVPLGEQLWLNTCPAGQATNDPLYPSRIDKEVAAITGRGMVALLDLHFNVISPCGRSAAQDMADSSYSLPFWRQVAQRYKYSPLVAFDLYNEPHDITDAVWRNGGLVQQGLVWYTAAGMQQLYDAVRQQGATNLVFITGPVWGFRPATMPVSGYNIVNAVHAYTCTAVPPPACDIPSATDPSRTLDNWVMTGATQPVMVTEFGWPDRDDGTYNANVIAYAERQGWGWSVFAWDGGTTGLFDLLIGTAYEPAPAGQPVLAGLAANLTASN